MYREGAETALRQLWQAAYLQYFAFPVTLWSSWSRSLYINHNQLLKVPLLLNPWAFISSSTIMGDTSGVPRNIASESHLPAYEAISAANYRAIGRNGTLQTGYNATHITQPHNERHIGGQPASDPSKNSGNDLRDKGPRLITESNCLRSHRYSFLTSTQTLDVAGGVCASSLQNSACINQAYTEQAIGPLHRRDRVFLGFV